MEQPEKKPASTRKSIVSAVALVCALMLVIYAAPMLQKKLKEWSSQNSTEQVAAPAATEPTADVPAELENWLPQVQNQLPTNEDGTAKYRLRHMRLNGDSSELLIDLQEIKDEVTIPFDLILKRDEFGRYISENESIPLKLYPPTK